MMLEATCGRCGETFVPESDQPDDLIHGVTELGDPCGGTGVVDGAWIAPGEPVPCTAFGRGCGGTVNPETGECRTCGAVTADETPAAPAAPAAPETPATPVHLLPTSCYVCGHAEHPDSSGDGHAYWSNADAARHFADADRRQRPVETVEARYVRQHRPY